MQNIIFAWRQDSRLNRFRSRHRCYSNQIWNLSSTNFVSFMKRFLLIDESLCHRRISLSSSHESLAQISHLLLEQFIDFYHDQFAQIWCFSNFTFVTRHVTSTSHSTSFATFAHDRSLSFETFAHDHSSLFEIFIHDRSSSLDALVTITHRFSQHFSRSLIRRQNEKPREIARGRPRTWGPEIHKSCSTTLEINSFSLETDSRSRKSRYSCSRLMRSTKSSQSFETSSNSSESNSRT